MIGTCFGNLANKSNHRIPAFVFPADPDIEYVPLFFQLTLIRAGWNELLIAGFSFRSTRLEDGILWADGQVITRYAHADTHKSRVSPFMMSANVKHRPLIRGRFL